MTEYSNLLNSDVGKEDMLEAPRRFKESGFGRVWRVLFACLAVLLLVIFLVHGSRPDMTPEQIVQLENYEGEQQARRIFNLYGLKKAREREQRENSKGAGDSDADSVADVVEQKPVAEIAESSAAAEPDDSEPEKSPTIVVAEATSDKEIQSESVSKTTVFVPAVEQATSATATATVNVEQPAAMVEGVQQSQVDHGATSGRILPVYLVNSAEVTLRDSPSYSSKHLRSMVRNAEVTLFGVIGDWAQVATNDGSGLTGYVPRSRISPSGVN